MLSEGPQVKLFVHQVTNSTHAEYGMWVISMNGQYLHKDGVWRPLCDLQRKDENGNLTAYFKTDEISIG